VNEVLRRLRAAVEGHVQTTPEVLAAHRRDSWVLSELRDLEGSLTALPVAVVEPGSTEEVARVLGVCHEMGTPVVPYGGGSGVCGGIVAPEGSVVLSTARLLGIVALEETDLCASFRAGTNGLEAERRVAEAGLTLGHWPQSIELSTVGGWVATRASGQFSTGYGSIEDMVLGLEVVLADGAVLRLPAHARSATGPDLRQLFLGCEGTLGIVTEVTLSLRRSPAARVGAACHFSGFAEGLDAVRSLLAAGFSPPVVRLYDPAESQRHFPEVCPDGRAMLLLLHEGPAALVDAAAEAGVALCAEAGGTSADAAAVDQWLEHRNRVPGFREFLERGIIVDTIEVTCPWSTATELYERVTSSLRQVEGILLATAHSSHQYRSGTGLYFTFAARPANPADMAGTYGECWRHALDATLALGGAISHHHGIGRVRRRALREGLGDSGVALLRTLKQALDPTGLLNPGVLIPDDPGSP
jgi:alkyldihydroxyacetonephosphate synthase